MHHISNPFDPFPLEIMSNERHPSELVHNLQSHPSELAHKSQSHPSDLAHKSQSHPSELAPNSKSHPLELAPSSKSHPSELAPNSKSHPSELAPNSKSHPSELAPNSKSHPLELASTSKDHTSEEMLTTNSRSDIDALQCHPSEIEFTEFSYFADVAGTNAPSAVFLNTDIGKGIEKILTEGLAKEVINKISGNHSSFVSESCPYKHFLLAFLRLRDSDWHSLLKSLIRFDLE
ncbi:hypothetical protein RRG08_038524 [Elysia crispata]|uniref:Uncharacterized protein n=1 Tax=Elysia crispata TaxID=231223 RepID=A0AAE1AHN0_9GAST|nr:hypothetical protein RRG08_038524 [Elysia crispata]